MMHGQKNIRLRLFRSLSTFHYNFYGIKLED